MEILRIVKVFYYCAVFGLMVTPYMMVGAFTQSEVSLTVQIPCYVWAVLVGITGMVFEMHIDEVVGYWRGAYEHKAEQVDRLGEEIDEYLA